MGLPMELGYHQIPTSEELKEGILSSIREDYPEYENIDDDALWGMLYKMFEKRRK